MSLVAENLSAAYDQKPVLHEINFTIKEGESVALLGPNGSGKSTLLKALTKTISYQGTITIGNRNLKDLTYKDLADLVAFVPQQEVAAFPFQVRDVIALARISKTNSLQDSKEDQAIVEQSAHEAGCADLLDRPITELSGGEHQRVLIARALAQQTPIILLDEPTSHLDLRHQVDTVHLVNQMTAQGKTVLIAIHDLNLAIQMCARAILLKQGRILIDAPVSEVIESKALDEAYELALERHVVDGRQYVLPLAR